MTIEYVKGDLFKSGCAVIAHGCNCFNSFGAGIALQMMEHHMPAWWADQMTMRGDKDKLGTFTFVDDAGRRVYNLYTQYSFSRTEVSADYDAIRKSFQAMRNHLIETKMWDLDIGIPKIGAGLAMGSWDRISEIVNDVFPDKTIYVYVLE